VTYLVNLRGYDLWGNLAGVVFVIDNKEAGIGYGVPDYTEIDILEYNTGGTRWSNPYEAWALMRDAGLARGYFVPETGNTAWLLLLGVFPLGIALLWLAPLSRSGERNRSASG
jgi:hypothetical protein